MCFLRRSWLLSPANRLTSLNPVPSILSLSPPHHVTTILQGPNLPRTHLDSPNLACPRFSANAASLRYPLLIFRHPSRVIRGKAKNVSLGSGLQARETNPPRAGSIDR